MKVDTVTDAAALGRLEPEWWDLFGRVPAASPFSSPAWLLPWWLSFTPGALHTVALRHDGRLVGLAPLYVEAGPVRRLLPLGIGVSDYLDVLIDPAHAGEAGAGLVEALAASRHCWDLWSAEEAPPGAAVLAFPTPAGCVSRVVPQSACPVLVLPSPPNTWSDAVPPRQRRKWRMARRRLARRSSAIESATAATLGDDLADLFRLHGARWQDRGDTGVLADPLVRRFHAMTAPALLAAGMLRLTTLRIDEAVVGIHYGMARGDRAYAYLGGFDPAFAFESPGTQLMAAAIEAAAADGAQAFHFLRGQEPYKYAWGAVDQWTSRRTIEPLR
ncbi:MAG TPA: GNAT family N-acetyltransferase [Lichenihabitans sp.]|jgi:CelD/BcsL family acetyltransferase involved in cellulose biosynthesis|nr:GNAT family N-acetyltransferase [Lichenihabitans sp.]